MGKENNVRDFFKDLADTIRFKNGTSGDLTPAGMADAISKLNIENYGTFTETVTCTEENGINNIESLVIGKEVTAITQSAYANFAKLRRLAFLGDTKTIGASAFSGCTNLGKNSDGEYDPSYVQLRDSITSVGADAFKNTTWYNAQKPEDGIVYIGKCCYKYKAPATPANVTLREDTTYITHSAFYGTNLLSVKYEGNSIGSIVDSAFQGCTNLQSVIIDNAESDKGVWISSYAFAGCTSLHTFYVGKVSTFGVYIFNKCSSLKKIRFDNINTLSMYSIRDSEYIEEIYIGYCGEIEAGGIYDLANLKKLIILNSDKLPTLSNNSILGAPNATIYVPGNMVGAWEAKRDELKTSWNIAEYNENE